MKKITFSTVILLAILIGCKTKTTSGDSKNLNITFDSKSNSKVTGTASFT